MGQHVVTMPQLGESVSEGAISRWLVQSGDSVSEFDSLVEILSDKVEAEVPAGVNGIVRELLVSEGAVVPIGAPIAVIEVAIGDQEATASTDHGTAATPSPGRVVAPPSGELHGLAEPSAGGAPSSGTRETVEARPEQALPAPAGAVAGPPPDRRGAEVAELDGDEAVRLTPLRQRIAETTTLAKATIPHAWQMQEVDMSGVAASLAAHRPASSSPDRPTLRYLSYVLHAAARALAEHRQMNATFAGDRIVVHRQVNLGVAIGLPEGVVVPVIRDADRRSVQELAQAVADLTARARAKTLTFADLSGGTFTVNNSGALGTLLSYSVINPGQAGILTMGWVAPRPAVVDGRLEVRRMMYLSLSLDHRIIDGLQAARFLQACRLRLETISADTELT